MCQLPAAWAGRMLVPYDEGNAHRPSNYMSSPPKNALCSYSHHSKRIKRSTIQYSTSTVHSPANENNWGSSSTFCPYCTVYLCGAQAKYTVPFYPLPLLFGDERTRQGSGGRASKTSFARAGLFPSRRVCSKRGLFWGMLSPGRSDVGGYFFVAMWEVEDNVSW